MAYEYKTMENINMDGFDGRDEPEMPQPASLPPHLEAIFGGKTLMERVDIIRQRQKEMEYGKNNEEILMHKRYEAIIHFDKRIEDLRRTLEENIMKAKESLMFDINRIEYDHIAFADSVIDDVIIKKLEN